MEKETKKDQLRYWQVYITAHSDTYKREINQTVGVVAVNIESLIQHVMSRYPDATIWTIQHRGKVDLPIIHASEFTHDEDKSGNVYQEVN